MADTLSTALSLPKGLPKSRNPIKRLLWRWLLPDIEKVINATVTARVDDNAGWTQLSGSGPTDRPWAEWHEDQQDALDAWRKSFLVRRIITLHRSYVVAGGIELSSKRPAVDKFIRQFWTHRKNRLARRLGPMADELTRAGELFPILFTNKVDGMSYVRFVPAFRIRDIETDPDDYEKELRYGQIQTATTEPKWWDSPETKPALDNPLMLHFAVNRPIGATRGESDLTPILKWALRYSNWLEDRVRLNRIRTRQGILHIQVADDQVEAKRAQYTRQNPLKSGILITGMHEQAQMLNLNIRANDAAPDGQALRLAVSTGSNTALHYLGEGESINYATAKEMGEPTARFYTERQGALVSMLEDLITIAYKRYRQFQDRAIPASWNDDLALQASVAETARADNLALAKAASDIVSALAEMKTHGWIDDPTAIRLAFKFAGEVIGEDKINHILSKPQQEGEN